MVQGNKPQRPAWLTLLFLAMVLPLWVMMLMMFLNPKRAQQQTAEAAPKAFPTLRELRQSGDINRAILSWKEQVEANPKAPDTDLTLLKIAIASERLLDPPDYGAALRAYSRLGQSYRRSPFAVHALFRAGKLAEQLAERDLALKLYEQIVGLRAPKSENLLVWQVGETESPPLMQGQPLRLEVERILDGYYRDRTLYKALAGVVRFCGSDKRYSYGLALLLTAVLVQGFLWLLPFTRKQYETMRKMQELQPEMKRIQETFKSDPRRMQMEVMGLYKRHHFNPMTGCFLGMVVQIPFLWAIFATIRHFQYPLAEASFLWVRSLALPDMPLLILYCASMYLTTRYGPGSDPSQAQQQKTMAWLMPLMFLFLFRGFPSGFLLYWLATNLLSMGQRYLIMRKPSEHVESQREAIEPHGESPALPESALAESELLQQEDAQSVPEGAAVAEESPSAAEPDALVAAPTEGTSRRAAALSRGVRRGGKRRKARPETVRRRP